MKRFILVSIFLIAVFLTSCDTISDNNNKIPEDTDGASDSEMQAGAETYSVDKISSALSAVTSDSVIGLYVGDYDTDGTNEAYVMTSGYQIPQGAENYAGIKLWFVKNDKPYQILEEGNYYLDPQIWEFPDKKLFCIDEYINGKANSKVFFVSGDSAYKYPDFGAKLVRESSDSADFYAIVGADTGANEASLYNSGEKPYYMYFDGNFFCEYGAISIREDQLRAIPGADEILTAINNGAYNIDGVFYRPNGIININVSKNAGSGNITHENITVVVSSGLALLVPKGELLKPLGNIKNSDMARSITESSFLNPAEFSYGGSYVAALIPNIAVYPEKFEY